MVDYTAEDEDATMAALGLGPSKPKRAVSKPTIIRTTKTQEPINEEDYTLKSMGIEHPVDLEPAKPAPLADRPGPTAQQSSVIPGVARLNGLTSQAMQGIPILSPLVDKAAAAIGASIQPFFVKPKSPLDLVTGETRPGSEPNFSDRYAANLERQKAGDAQFARENPISSMIANVAGGTASMAPLAATGLGSAILGTNGSSLGLRALTAAAGQGAIGGADAGLRGDNPLLGAGIGAAGGFGGTIAGDVAQKTFGSALKYIRPAQGELKGMHPVTVDKLVYGLQGENPATIASAMDRIGPHGMVGDLNHGMTDIAIGLSHDAGPGRGVVRSAYQARADQQGARIEGALDSAMGPARNLVQDTNMLTEARKAAADPLYEKFRTTQIPPTQQLTDLIPRLKAAGGFTEAEKLAGIKGIPLTEDVFSSAEKGAYPTTEAWDLVKRGLDSQIESAYGAGNKTRAAALTGLKGELLEAIDKSPAGAVYKEARNAFAEKSHLIDQLNAGKDTFLGGRSGLSVDELREELKGLSTPERLARQQGLRAAAHEALGATANGDTKIRNQMLAPNNQEKIRLVMGDKNRADELIKTLQQEKHIGDKTQAVIGGSQTSGNTGARENLRAPTVEPWGFDLTKPATWLPPSLRDEFSYAGIRQGSINANYEKAKGQLADVMTRRNGPDLPQFIDALKAEADRHSRRARMLSSHGDALGALLAGAGSSTARRNLPAQ